MKIKNILLLLGVIIGCLGLPDIVNAQQIKFDPKNSVIVEAESFASKGGWVVDQQFMDIMGSPMLLAHGLGKPVLNANTQVKFPKAGTYRVFVRTRNWAATWTPQYAPGRFRLLVNGVALDSDFGSEGKEWHWQQGENITVKPNELNGKIELLDQTGFDGRVDAICLTCDPNFMPPNDLKVLNNYRRQVLGLPDVAPNAEGGPFDLVVVGGGIAGTCTAISAARLGLNVALIQDRPLVGGNNSSEVRVHLQGRINLPPYPNLGNLVAQMNHRRSGNAMPADYYEDEKKMDLLAAESGVKTFFNTRGVAVEMNDKNLIKAVIGKHVETGKELRFEAPLFADCTGDGNIGYLAGADWRMGRESKSETDESLAPEVADKMTMGASVQWYSVETDRATTFPALPWAIQFNHDTAKPMVKGDWDWETGLNLDQIWDFEQIRDHGFRAAYGHWAYMKNQAAGEWPEKVLNRQLGWVAYIAGKRESRRLLGDVILKEQDIVEQREWPDASVTTTWTIDLHYPTEKNSRDFPNEEFMTIARHKQITPYAIPYRCFYSRNINNLFMAGRDISVTHVALGTIRVQRTGGMMGEVVGMAASLCKKYSTLPRGVYEKHLDELKALMTEGVAPPSVPRSDAKMSQPSWLKDAGKNVARDAKIAVSSEHTSHQYPGSNINDGKYNLADNAGRWVSNSDDAEPWVTLTWEKPVKINAARILTGQAGDGTPKTPITDLTLQTKKDGQWVNLPGTDVTENLQCDVGYKFPETTVQEIRLLITGTSENLARIWEVELYLLP